MRVNELPNLLERQICQDNLDESFNLTPFAAHRLYREKVAANNPSGSGSGIDSDIDVLSDSSVDDNEDL